MKALARRLGTSILLSVLLGCPGRADIYDEPYATFGPITVAEHLVWSVTPTQTLLVLDPKPGTTVGIRRLGFEPRDIKPAGDRVLALGVSPDGARLAVVGVLDDQVDIIDLPTSFDRILAAPNGQSAVLLFDPDRARRSGAPAVRNANEVAIVDLEDGVASRVVLNTESLAPRAVDFGPRGELCVITLDNAVVIVDLEDPSRRLQVPLVLQGGARLSPRQVLFSEDGEHLFMRVAGTADVLSLSIDNSGAELAGHINFLFASGAQELREILVPRGPGFEGLVAAVFSTPGNEGSIAALLDARGDRSRTRAVQLQSDVEHIEELGEGLFLLHGTSAIVGWQPLEDRVDEDRLAGTIRSAPSVAGAVAFFSHNSQQTDYALSVVSVAAQSSRIRVSQRPLVLSGPAQDIYADPATSTVLLGVQVPREDSGAAPNYDGWETGETGSLVLLSTSDGAIADVVVDEIVSKVGIVGDYYYALHPGKFGDMTFVPKAQPARASAHRRDGFLLTGLLDLADED